MGGDHWSASVNGTIKIDGNVSKNAGQPVSEFFHDYLSICSSFEAEQYGERIMKIG